MYKIFDTLKVFITDTQLFMYIPNGAYKIASISNNQMQHSILLKAKDSNKEEFESTIDYKNNLLWSLEYNGNVTNVF